MKAVLTNVVRGFGSVVFPPSCVQCRGLVSDDAEFRHVCTKCAGEIDYVRAPHCATCGHPFYGVVEGERLCPHCEGLAPAFDEGRTAVLLKGPGRALVHELKYHRGLHVLADIEAIFRRAAHVLDLARGAALVPVPLHPRKLRERGYNQSELIAACLARAAGGGARVERVLRRTVDTVSQTHHDRRTRQANLKNAFALAPGVRISAGDSYLLVDDVFTTGSTLNSCALALRRAGGADLNVVTFGHG
jgi:ComF family protein